MSSQHEILRDLDEYCRKAKVRPSTVCRNATGNPRLRDRLEARLERVDADVAALREYMAKNPVDGLSEAAE